MPTIPQDTDLISWNRYFAAECNNKAWDLVAKKRSKAEDLELLNAAHAAAFHWASFGLELNDMRAKMLLAEVHAQLGFGDSAMELAKEVKQYFSDQDAPDWEQAFVHMVHAHAAYAAGHTAIHAESYAAATTAVHAIADAKDKKIALETFAKVPSPS